MRSFKRVNSFPTKLSRKLLKSQKGVIKLNLGCGTDYKDGWINIDNNMDQNIEKLDLDWDLRKPLPLKDGTVSFVFNEHFFEHMTVEEAQVIFLDLKRVLKPGGVLRIAMPDLAEAVEHYMHLPIEDDPVIKKFNLDIQTRAERLNAALRWWGHMWLYDWEELERRLRQAGFTKIKRCKIGKSSHPELRDLETRAESLLIAEVTI